MNVINSINDSKIFTEALYESTVDSNLEAIQKLEELKLNISNFMDYANTHNSERFGELLNHLYSASSWSSVLIDRFKR